MKYEDGVIYEEDEKSHSEENSNNAKAGSSPKFQGNFLSLRNIWMAGVTLILIYLLINIHNVKNSDIIKNEISKDSNYTFIDAKNNIIIFSINESGYPILYASMLGKENWINISKSDNTWKNPSLSNDSNIVFYSELGNNHIEVASINEEKTRYFKSLDTAGYYIKDNETIKYILKADFCSWSKFAWHPKMNEFLAFFTQNKINSEIRAVVLNIKTKKVVWVEKKAIHSINRNLTWINDSVLLLSIDEKNRYYSEGINLN